MKRHGSVAVAGLAAVEKPLAALLADIYAVTAFDVATIE